MSHDCQVGNWVASSILTFADIEERVNALEQFIIISKVTITACVTSNYCCMAEYNYSTHPIFLSPYLPLSSLFTPFLSLLFYPLCVLVTVSLPPSFPLVLPTSCYSIV